MERALEMRRTGDRRHFSVTEVVSIVMLVLQFGTLVWGAATLNANVRQVKEQVGALQAAVGDSQHKLEQLAIDVGVMKGAKR